MQPTLCPICKATENFTFIEKYAEWDLFECKKYTSQWWEPLKHPGRDFYEEEYDMIGSSGNNAIGWGNKQFIKNPVGNVVDPPLSLLARLLDIGCCSGDFMNKVKDRFEAWGIDISRRSIAVAKSLYRFEHVYPETIEEFNKRVGLPKFDVVTFFEVIEHIEAPAEFLADAKKLMAPDAYLVLSTPDRECVRFGWHDHPPQHIMKWAESSLRYMLENEGFEIVEVKRQPLSFRYFNYIIFGQEVPTSFGIVSKIKSLLRKKKLDIVSADISIAAKEPAVLKYAKAGAKLKAKIFNALISPAVLVARLLNLKWQSIYVVARLKN